MPFVFDKRLHTQKKEQTQWPLGYDIMLQTNRQHTFFIRRVQLLKTEAPGAFKTLEIN
jgi:hypothetical protein